VLDTPVKLRKILLGMNRALGEIPLTIKVRTGVKDGKNTAHKLLPDLQSWGVSSFAVRQLMVPHGSRRTYTTLDSWKDKAAGMLSYVALRTLFDPRLQRYTKLADWDYIKMCADTLRDLASDNGLHCYLLLLANTD